jgi:hypothetical protein
VYWNKNAEVKLSDQQDHNRDCLFVRKASHLWWISSSHSKFHISFGSSNLTGIHFTCKAKGAQTLYKIESRPGQSNPPSRNSVDINQGNQGYLNCTWAYFRLKASKKRQTFRENKGAKTTHFGKCHAWSWPPSPPLSSCHTLSNLQVSLPSTPLPTCHVWHSLRAQSCSLRVWRCHESYGFAYYLFDWWVVWTLRHCIRLSFDTLSLVSLVPVTAFQSSWEI